MRGSPRSGKLQEGGEAAQTVLIKLRAESLKTKQSGTELKKGVDSVKGVCRMVGLGGAKVSRRT
ncbi:hypothetical protein SAMN05421644_1152 [Allochromatium warmingii]|uniref:Uncharacterized protein n=1 Tax=Allochromatium warmingii TaxID=61595 RepID=A0A1H3EVR9_ALLWA|nr:hypothetical protein SAMN05421644_1152 [Allochromatium warmingii]